MTNEATSQPGGPPREIAIEQGGGKPAVINCPECGAENIQGTDYCVNCQGDLRTLDIPPETWSPAVGVPGESVAVIARGELVEVNPTDTIREVIAALRDADSGCAVIVEGGRIAGIFTERDVLNRVTPNREQVLDRSVAELMTKDPVTLKEDDSILVALNEMSIGGFRNLPIVGEDGTPRAVLTGRDVLDYVDGLTGGSDKTRD